MPDEDEIEGAKSRYTLIVTLARRERLTVRQLIGTGYEGTTLRDHYGLARPANRNAAPVPA